MNCDKVIFSQHAFTRMFEQSISPELVTRAVRAGEIIAEYPDDRPFPSALVLYFEHKSALHLVVGEGSLSPDDKIISDPSRTFRSVNHAHRIPHRFLER